MSEPKIIETQEQIIEMDGVRYRLEDISHSGLERGKHQPWCQFCDGNARAPLDDEDRVSLFDHYCYGHQKPLLCDPDRALVYRRIEA